VRGRSHRHTLPHHSARHGYDEFVLADFSEFDGLVDVFQDHVADALLEADLRLPPQAVVSLGRMPAGGEVAATRGMNVTQRTIARFGPHLLPLLVVVGLTVAVRLAWVAIIHARPISDYAFYYQTAGGLAAGHGYAILGHPTAFFPVGYPAFLAALFALFGTSLTTLKVANVALWALTAALAYVLGVQLGGRRVGLIGGLIVALYPDYVIYSSLAASENLFVPLLLGACCALAGGPARRPSARRAALAGALLGLAILVRSTALLVPLLAALIIWLGWRSRRGALAALCVVAAAACVVAPWAVRNALVMGAPAVSTNGGYTLWIGLNSRATGGVDVQGGGQPWPITTVHAEVSSDATDTGRALHFIVDDPGRFVGLVPAKLAALLAPDSAAVAANLKRPVGPIKAYAGARVLPSYRWRRPSGLEARLLGDLQRFHIALAALHYTYLALGAAGVALGLLRRRPAALWIAVLMGFWIVFNVTLIHGQPRFLLSVSPLLAPAIGLLATAAAAKLVMLGHRYRVAPSVLG
jgi:4-amino-4-deoxy-L-arabinose transferase-like glycosyltransferase